MTHQLRGDARTKVAADFAALYRQGDSIRAIVARSGRSYGTVRDLLLEAGVKLRTRAGTRKRRA